MIGTYIDYIDYSAEHSGTSRKQFMLLDGDPIVIHTIRKFVACDKVSEILVALRAEDIAPFEQQLGQQDWGHPGRGVKST